MDFRLVKNPTLDQTNNSVQKDTALYSLPILSNGDTIYYSILTPTDNSYFENVCSFDSTQIRCISNSKHFKTNSTYPIYKIYALLSDDAKIRNQNTSILPSSIDYKKDLKLKLHPVYTFNKGILVRCIYYAEVESNINPTTGFVEYTYDNPILKCEMEYHTLNSKYVEYRIVKRYWQTLDNIYDPTYKESIKYYNKKEARREGTIRRQNIIDELVVTVVGLIYTTEPTLNDINEIETKILPLFNHLNNDITNYISGNIDAMITNIATIDVSIYQTGESIGNWLENIIPDTSTSIREYMLAKLNDGYLSTYTTVTYQD